MSLLLAQPGWLWLALPVTLWLVMMERRTRRGSAWRGLVDAHLLDRLLVRPDTPRRRGTVLTLCAVAAYSGVLALTGPGLRLGAQDYMLATPLLLASTLLGALAFRRGWLS